MGLLNFIGELIITRVEVANPSNTMLVISKNGNRQWVAPENIPDSYDHNSHEYAGQTASGYQAISEKENKVTKKGLLEGILSLL